MLACIYSLLKEILMTQQFAPVELEKTYRLINHGTTALATCRIKAYHRPATKGFNEVQ